MSRGVSLACGGLDAVQGGREAHQRRTRREKLGLTQLCLHYVFL